MEYSNSIFFVEHYENVVEQLLTVPSLQGTLAKRSKHTLKSNFANEPFSPSRNDSKIADPDKTKIYAKSTCKWLIMKKPSA